MKETFTLFGAEISPFSVKVRSYLRYKKIPYKWITNQQSKEYLKHAKLPLIPLLLSSDGTSMQDSTPIIESLEKKYKDPSLYPEDSRLSFIAALIEEYADEWGNKHMFHYRWSYKADQNLASKRLAAVNVSTLIKYIPIVSSLALDKGAQMIRNRMLPRISFVGSSDKNKDQIESSFKRLIRLLDNHFKIFPYLFGGRPSIADFGLWGQLYNSWIDVTARNLINQRPSLVDWIKKMENPKIEGDFVGWSDVHKTIEPILEKEIGGLFLPWSNANLEALNTNKKEFSINLEGKDFSQKSQKYHGKSLLELIHKYERMPLKESLKPILDKTGCLNYLRR
jgi:glutathione S-transferase